MGKVAQSTQGDNRCFFLENEDGTAEDFSAKKCVDAIELNPPYVKAEPPKEKTAEGDKGQSSASVDHATAGAKEATGTADQPSKEAGDKVDEKTTKDAKTEEAKEEKQAEEAKAESSKAAETTAEVKADAPIAEPKAEGATATPDA